MLQIKGISKKYITGNLEQMALNDVSLDLRDSEFVAILGPSGSGKTTLLNIIGGLDRYDTGDLIINGVTTKRYKDRDWDSYRNHTIGFVFQSYNLIPHQTVLANVELALTISGISKAERRRRAEDALVKVGLKDHIHKIPNQLSGGQMQRVAIARALVNDPDILLADEPTGALDSETSLQVMDLLKEVAKDRLVVMVTHNPELAEEYATRIVRLKDGKIIGDTDPFDASAFVQGGEPVHRNLGKASMSFLTALTLSFKNLWTKKARTILVAFAGSIGIIGIALILSLSNGVNKYIEDTEKDTLSEYPLSIQKTSLDLASLMGGGNEEEEEKVEDAEVREIKMVSDMFSTMTTNDLGSLKMHLEDPETDIYKYAKSIEYTYNYTPWIYRVEGNKLWQVCPDMTVSRYGADAGIYSTMGISTNYFNQLPTDDKLYKTQYDVITGKWPEKADEAVLVLMGRHFISDYLLYILGFRDMSELEKMLEDFSEGKEVVVPESARKYFKYEDFIGLSFKVVPAHLRYKRDEKHNVWTDKSEDKEYLRTLADNGRNLKIVGVVVPAEDARATVLNPGVNYTDGLVAELVSEADNSEIVKSQKAHRATNVFSGKPFSDENDDSNFDISSLFTVDEEAFAQAFSFNADGLNLDMSGVDLSGLQNMDSMDLSELGNMDLTGLEDMGNLTDLSNVINDETMSNAFSGFTEEDMKKITEGVEVDVTSEEISNLLNKVIEEFQKNNEKEIQSITDGLSKSVSDFLQSEEMEALINEEIQNMMKEITFPTITAEDLTAMLSGIMAGFGDYISSYDPTSGKSIQEYVSEYLSSPEVQAILEAQAEELNSLGDDIVMPEFDMETFSTKVMAAFQEYQKEHPIKAGEELIGLFSEYFASEEGQKVLEDSVAEIIDTEKIEKKLAENLSGIVAKYMTSMGTEIGKSISKEVEKSMASAMAGYNEAIEKAMQGYAANIEKVMTAAMTDFATQLSTQLSNQLGDAFSFNQDALSDAFKFEMTEKELEELMTSLMSREGSSYEGNLKKLGYADFDEPSAIMIYPVDFESKEGIIKILDDYNASMEKQGKKEKVVKYTDIVGTLMSSVTDIINSISYVLIAFVAISLVVSSIMIGVITYISVLERRKEIGILRAIGASKRNISSVFNAETFIIGLLAGLFGVIIARLLLIPGNYILHTVGDTDRINAVLPIGPAIILVILSIVLTLIGGLIPSKKAAKSDPVTALRTE